MAPMKLYGAVLSWNVTRCATALEEAGSDYEIVPINFATAEHKSPEHLARNVPYSSRSLSRFCCFFSPQWKCIGPFRSRAGGAAVVASAVDLTFL
jgi:hypothetical protein